MLFFFVFYILLEVVIFASVDLQCRLKILPFLYHCHSAALFVGFFFFFTCGTVVDIDIFGVVS